MDKSKQIIEIYLADGKGTDWYLEGPQNYTFYVKPLAKILPSEMELIRSLPIMSEGRIILPILSRSYIVAIIATKLNPNVKITLLTFDSGIQEFVSEKTKNFANIQSLLIADSPAFDEPLQAVLFSIQESTDRLLTFDLIERLTMVMPNESLMTITVPIVRRKDLFTKMNKHIKNVVSDRFVRKGGVIMRGLTKKEPSWTARESQHAVSIKEGIVNIFTRPGCGYKAIAEGGLALAESIDFDGGENIIELHCANGLTSILLIKRMLVAGKEAKQIILQDSRIRSFEMCQKNIEANKITFAQAELSFHHQEKEKFDIIIAHPPHFKNRSAIEDIMSFAQKQLSCDGKLYLVSKHHATYNEIAKDYNLDVSLKKRRGYQITVCQRDV